MQIQVAVESTPKRAFASALDWPGWCRAGKTPDLALQALEGYAERYAPVAERAGLRFPQRRVLEVVETVAGTTTTDFGAPAVPAAAEATCTAAQSKRLVALLEASWSVFDDAVAAAPEVLTKGPRGGGRDRDKLAAHVLSAEAAYARKLGVRHKEPAIGDRAAITALRSDLLDLMARAHRVDDELPWPPRYAARRIAWHILDHVWELEDRTP